MNTSSDRTLFFIAAAFNWGIATSLAFPGSFAWKLFGLTPPENLLWLHLFLVIVAVFGFAYFWIGLDASDKRPLIVFSAIGKISVFVTVGAHYLAGSAPLMLVGPASADLVFAVLFLRVAARLRTASREVAAGSEAVRST